MAAVWSHFHNTIETVSAFSPASNPGRSNEKTRVSGGCDMGIQKAYLFTVLWCVVYANVNVTIRLFIVV